MTNREKEGRWKYKNLSVLRSFLDEIESIFYNYLRAMKNWGHNFKGLRLLIFIFFTKW